MLEGGFVAKALNQHAYLDKQRYRLPAPEAFSIAHSEQK